MFFIIFINTFIIKYSVTPKTAKKLVLLATILYNLQNGVVKTYFYHPTVKFIYKGIKKLNLKHFNKEYFQLLRSKHLKHFFLYIFLYITSQLITLYTLL